MTNLMIKAVEKSLVELDTVKFKHIRTKWRLAVWQNTLEPLLRAIETSRASTAADYLKKYKARLNGEDTDKIVDLVPGTPEFNDFIGEYNDLMAQKVDVKLQPIKQSWLEDFDEAGPQPSISALAAIMPYVTDDSEKPAPEGDSDEESS